MRQFPSILWVAPAINVTPPLASNLYILTELDRDEVDAYVRSYAKDFDLVLETTPRTDELPRLASMTLNLHNDGFRLGLGMPDRLLTYYGELAHLIIVDAVQVLNSLVELGWVEVLEDLQSCDVLLDGRHECTRTTIISDFSGSQVAVRRSPRAKVVRQADADVLDWWNALIRELSSIAPTVEIPANTLVSLDNRRVLHGRRVVTDASRYFRRWWAWEM